VSGMNNINSHKQNDRSALLPTVCK